MNSDNMRNQALRRGRLDVWAKVVRCYPMMDRGIDRNGDAARRAAIELRDDILGAGRLSCEGGWHVEADGEAYRVACMLQS